MKKLPLLLCASLYAMTCGAAPKQNAGAPPANPNAPASAVTVSPGGACAFLDAATINGITGLNITEVKDNGDSCVYVDPKAPLSPIVQMFAQALGHVFGGSSPLRLPNAPNGVPAPQTGAGIIVRQPKDAGDLTNVSVHDYAQSELAGFPPQARCGALQDVSGLNASEVVCLGGAIGHGGVMQNGKLIMIMYLASGNATDDVMGKLLAAAAAKM